LAASFASDGVEFGVAAALGGLPFCLEPAAVLQAIERRVERSLPDLKRIFGDLTEALDNGVAVDRFEGGDFENEHVERAVEEVGGFMPRHSR